MGDPTLAPVVEDSTIKQMDIGILAIICVASVFTVVVLLLLTLYYRNSKLAKIVPQDAEEIRLMEISSKKRVAGGRYFDDRDLSLDVIPRVQQPSELDVPVEDSYSSEVLEFSAP